MQRWPFVRDSVVQAPGRRARLAAGWAAAAFLLCAGSAAWPANSTAPDKAPAGVEPPAVASPAAASEASAARNAAKAEGTATAVLDQLVEDLWLHSDHYFHEGDYETSSRIGRLAGRLDPNYVEAITTTAWLLRQGLSRPNEALALYHRGMKDNPDSYEFPFELGLFYYDMKSYALAVHYLRQAIRPESPPPVHHMLAHAYERLGRPADALRVWRETIVKYPNDLAGRRNLEKAEKAMEAGHQ